MSTGTAQIRILAVDDHPIVREGIAALIAIQPDMILVSQASDGREAIQQFRTHRPDVTVMDLQMPGMNGLDALIAIRNEFPNAKIAQGYLLKNALHKDLLDTIRGAYVGKRSVSPEASLEIVEHATDESLTPAEISVLRLIAEGRANKEIADRLSTTEESVKSRVKNILSKLGANDRTHATTIALKRGIIEL
jgi:DNA-binding NarL/FixJ family response regulator